MLFFRTPDNRKMLENNEKAGRLVRVMPGCYSNDLATDAGMQVRLNLVRILKHLRPHSVISHCSALKNDFGGSDGFVVLTVAGISDNYIHQLPAMRVLATPGPGPLAGDADIGGIYVSSPARALLENLEPRRPIKGLEGAAKQANSRDLMLFMREIAPDDQALSGMLSLAELANKASGNRWHDELEALNKTAADRLTEDARHPARTSKNIGYPDLSVFSATEPAHVILA